MKSKTLIITIVIIAIITILWYFKKKTKDVSSEDNENQEEKSSEGISILGIQIGNNTGRKPKDPYSQKDTSKFAKYADISTTDALKLAKEAVEVHGYYDKFVTDDNMETLWLPHVQFDLKDQSVRYYKVSERTFNALIEAGYNLKD